MVVSTCPVEETVPVPVAVLDLDDGHAVDPRETGGKGAAIAIARAAGLPALGGFVLTAPALSRSDALPPTLRASWEELSEHGDVPLVVRSSSVIEDSVASSMAGRFTTVVGTRSWEEFLAAVDAVRESAAFVARTEGLPVQDVPIAVLVQPMLVPETGGVLFGVDPVTGRSDRFTVAAVRGLPEHLVGGTETGSRYELDGRGRTHAYVAGPDPVRLPRRQRRALVGLARDCARVFGRPQDIEWAIDRHGAVVLLQSRPVTTEITGVPNGPVFGPGPIAETFPDPLTSLETDLWVEPLDRALRTVFDILGVVPAARLDTLPRLVVVDGRVAVNLDLFEAPAAPRGFTIARRVRALRAAWRVGRLRAALLGLADDEIRRADDALLAVASPAVLTDRQLVATLGRLRDALASLHSYEMLVGLVLRPATARSSAQSVALRVLARGRSDGLADAEIVRRDPIVLALCPPVVGGCRLPREVAVPEWVSGAEDAASTAREALRLRVRWAQEAGARFATELGDRMARDGRLGAAVEVRRLHLDDLEAVVRGRAVLVPEVDETQGPPPTLPARFRLSDLGRPVPVRLRRHRDAGAGAGGGRAAGPVCLDPASVSPGSVLVVRTLDARLAPILPGLSGLVAETGSVLAHLAILARELGIATVVGLEGATTRWAEGTIVQVDGTSGVVVRAPDGGGAGTAPSDDGCVGC
jgi:phosphohistidine swiveling domain-containing protein